MPEQEQQTPQQKLDHDLSELETRLERVRVLYEQYFMGIEKREPGIQRKDIDRRIAQLRKARMNSTAVRFKFQTTVQRYNTLMNYWNRTCREIEKGTYHRHVKLAERRRLKEEQQSQVSKDDVQQRAASAADAKAQAQADLASMLDGDLDLDSEMNDALSALDAPAKDDSSGLGKLGKSKGMKRGHTHPTLHLGKALSKSDTKRSATSPRGSLQPKALEPLKKRSSTTNTKRTATGDPTQKRSATANPLAGLGKKAPPAPSMRPKTAAKPAAAAPAKKSPAGGLSKDRLQALHASYTDARKKTNATAVSYEKLEKNIRETEKKLRAKHKGKNVDFEVGIKNGKAILKPKLK